MLDILIAIIVLVVVICIYIISLNILSKNNEEVFSIISLELAKKLKISLKNYIKRNVEKPKDNSSQDEV